MTAVMNRPALQVQKTDDVNVTPKIHIALLSSTNENSRSRMCAPMEGSSAVGNIAGFAIGTGIGFTLVVRGVELTDVELGSEVLLVVVLRGLMASMS
ncbi:MAG: uncharacterized protein KVP18_001226 [Porospora cf. gigantea A]|uniref:uncharacterized protein n=1 Tax=Porospora cf. gigantea A TaxID=2853593 RepID=UPI00355A3C0C|nr:MAG: hypothetical protein KVP18_001226 [Porospora cf. gigantea A]